MTWREDDREIARLFQEQRQADETSAPDFREVLSRPHDLRATPARRILRPALAAVSVLLAVVAAALLLNRPRPTDRESELLASGSAIAAWKAPTDSLLETPGSELMSQLPVLASPAFETSLDSSHQ